MELSKTLRMPIKNKENIIRFIIGGILDIVPVLDLLSSGYAFLLMRDHAYQNASEDLPEWKNWGTLFKYGLLTFLVGLGYLIIPLIIIGLGVAAEYPHVAILEYVGVTLDIIGGICLLGAIFFFPMGILLFAIDDEFSSAFSFFHVIDTVFKHIGLYLRAFVVIIIMGFILGLLSAIPFVGWIISVFVGFYLMLESALLLGDVGQSIVERLKGVEAAEAAEPVATPAEPTTAADAEKKEEGPTEEEKTEPTVPEQPAEEKKEEKKEVKKEEKKEA